MGGVFAESLVFVGYYGGGFTLVFMGYCGVGFTLVFMGYYGVGFLMEILGLFEWNIVYARSRDVNAERGVPTGVGSAKPS